MNNNPFTWWLCAGLFCCGGGIAALEDRNPPAAIGFGIAALTALWIDFEKFCDKEDR